MAGRVTHLRDWAEKDGGWELPVTMKAGARIGIEGAAGRALTADEVAQIERATAAFRFMATGFQDATAQDVKRTLANIAKLPPAGAATAYRRSDMTTTCLIDEALHFSLGIPAGSPQWTHPSGENIAKAAAAALEQLPGRRGGRPVKEYRHHLAIYALELWAQLGCTDMRAWAHEDTATPLVNFVAHIASMVDGEMLDASTVVDLLKMAKQAR